MNDIRNEFIRYIYNNLGLTISVGNWDFNKKVPYYLIDIYTFHRTIIQKNEYLLVEPKHKETQTPAVIVKHLNVLKEISGLNCIYLVRSINSFNKKRMIEKKIPFVVPGNQMYLPILGIDLRDFYLKNKTVKDFISPSAQAVIIYILNNKNDYKLTATSLAEILGYSNMTMGRALDEISENKMLKILRNGREKMIQIPVDLKEFWFSVKDQLSTPIVRKFMINNTKHQDNWVKSGLSALSDISMLNQPMHDVFAIDKKTSRQLKEQNIEFLYEMFVDSLKEIEVWKYNPNLFANNKIADPFSLYLSLRLSDDERVIQAINKMMEQIKW